MTSEMLTIEHDRAWLKTYEQTDIRSSIEMPSADTSLLEVFDRFLNKYADRTAFVCRKASITYNELDVKSRQMAAYIQSLGLGKGDKVALMMPNIIQYPITMIGILRAGCTLVNVNPLYTSHELEHQLNDSQAKALFIVENFAKTYQDVENKGNIEHVVVTSIGDMYFGSPLGTIVDVVVRHVKKMVPKWKIPNHVKFLKALSSVAASSYKRPAVSLTDLAILQYTGGTTGVAKGAMLTHGNIVANMLQSQEFINSNFPEDENTHDMKIIVALPLYHIFSFTVCGLLCLEKGFTGVLIPNPRDIPGFIKEIGKHNPVLIPAVNTLFNALVNDSNFKNLNHENLRMALGGGMSVLPNTAHEWEKQTSSPILEGYGLSETSPVVTMTPPKIEKFTGTIGIPAPATDVKLIDDDENEVAFGERGEISVKGPQVMAGYWQRPEATADSMTADGYFKTGDIAVMDEHGYFTIVDRKKDMILVSGFNVYPNEVEAAMTEHPKILECGVIGVFDEKSHEAPKIYVVKKDSSLTEKEVREFAKEHLTGYKRPRHVEFIDELPKSPVGKILRKELRIIEEQKNPPANP